jgi:hypothetical protein
VKNQNGQDQDIQLNEILKHLAKKINLESLYHTNHLFKTGGFFYNQINKLPSEPLTDHFEEVLLPKLLDF